MRALRGSPCARGDRRSHGLESRAGHGLALLLPLDHFKPVKHLALCLHVMWVAFGVSLSSLCIVDVHLQVGDGKSK